MEAVPAASMPPLEVVAVAVVVAPGVEGGGDAADAQDDDGALMPPSLQASMHPSELPVVAAAVTEDRALLEGDSVGEVGDSLCVECEDQVASMYCLTCAECYCDPCFGQQHGKGRRREHESRRLAVKDSPNVATSKVATRLHALVLDPGGGQGLGGQKEGGAAGSGDLPSDPSVPTAARSAKGGGDGGETPPGTRYGAAE